MTQNKKRNILYALSVGCICVAGFLLLMRHQGETRQMQTQQTVVVTSGGFEPAMLTLRLGSEVLFFNRSNVDVWPASDLHPTHGLYPEFDSKRPVEHGQGWNFQFNKSGKWKYHDHLHPEIIGEIIVLDESGSAVTEVDCNLSLRIPECYQLELQRLTQERGASAALDKIVEWYGSDNQFALDCHGYTHIVGKAAFRRFSQNETLDMGENFRACGYGFFHGFIEAFVQEHGTVDGSREFCLDVSQVSNIDNINKSYIACFHGIGHGLVDGSDPRDYGDSQRFIDDGLKICDQVGVNYREKYLCASGVFNSLAIAYNEPKYKLDFDADIPYNICGVQQADFAKEGCLLFKI